ncbi:hypothetical protein JVU11DRAFT_10641 [Chiua virens]|nr:hypothetical protein JVU11DRAFT_10641 [Chiua virens]
MREIPCPFLSGPQTVVGTDDDEPAPQCGYSHQPASSSTQSTSHSSHCSPSGAKPAATQKHQWSPTLIMSSSKAGAAAELESHPHKCPSPNVYIQVPVPWLAAFAVPPSATIIQLGECNLQVEVVQLSSLIHDLLREVTDLHGVVNSQGWLMVSLCQHITTLPLDSPPPPPLPSPPSLLCIHICYTDAI